MSRRAGILGAFTAILGALGLAQAPRAAPPAEGAVVVLRGARIVDGTGGPPVENGAIVIRGREVVDVGPAGAVKPPEGARVVDLAGRTVIPGLISAHSHVGLVLGGKNRDDAYARDNVLRSLDQFEAYGVTAFLSLGLNRDLVYELRAAQREGKLPGATIFSGDRGFGVKNGAPPLPVAADQLYKPDTPEEARKFVREAAARHPDMMKLWVDDLFGKAPKMDRAIYHAIIDEAHRAGAKVAAHVFYLADAKSLVADGIDVLAHSVRDAKVDAELVAAMKAKGTWYVPTLAVDESFFGFADHPEWLQDRFLAGALSPEVKADMSAPDYRARVEKNAAVPIERRAFENALANVKALHDAGVHVAMGTDSGGNPSRIPGWAEHRELQLMVRAGLTPMQAIVAATQGSAALVGARDRGTIAKGHRADLLVLAGDPLQDVTNTTRIVAVWHDGREVTPRVAAAAR